MSVVRDAAHVNLEAGYVDGATWDDPRDFDRESTDPNVALSTVRGRPDRHMPAIDIDHPCVLVPSSTPGHFHLYIDKVLTGDEYEVLLGAMVDCGIVQRPWADRLGIDGATVLRLPHVKKPVTP